MIEKGGEGSKVAGPVAREIFDYWFNIQNISPTVTATPSPNAGN
jgi:ribosomal protein L14